MNFQTLSTKKQDQNKKSHMNKSKVIIVSVIVMFVESMGSYASRAQELFNALLSATCISTNQAGGLVYQQFGNKDLIRECAADEGVTNTTGLSLVYNLTADALQIVTGTNNAAVGTNHVIVGTNQFLICSPLTFTDILSISGTNTNKVELLASVFVETNTVASGTLAATERFHYAPTNILSSFSLVGRIQYAVAASGTNAAKLYRGVLVVGSEPANDEDGDNDSDGNAQGHNGNQGGNGNDNHGNDNHGNDNHGNDNHGNDNHGNNGNHLGQNSNGNNGHHGK